LTSATTPEDQPANLPVGIRESLQRLDDGLAASEADLRGLFDLLHHDGQVPQAATVFLQRKMGLLGHLREDLQGMPNRIAGRS
jgi:hypothetical protein